MRLRRFGFGSQLQTLGAYGGYKAFQAAKAVARRIAAGNGKGPRGNPKAHENYMTTQHDVVSQYKRKRMPKGKKRRWVKFSKKVRYVIDKQLGTNTVVRNDSGTSTGYCASVNTTTWVGPQVLACCALYGSGGTSSGSNNTYGQDDLAQIFVKDNMSIMAKLRFKSAVLDVTISSIVNGAATVPLEIDVYHVRARGYGKKTDTGANDLLTVMKDTYTTPNQDASSQPRTTGLGRGETLFDVPGLLGTLQWTITKKTKVFLPAGGQATYQIRDAKDHIISGEPFKSNINANTMQYKGLTQFIVFVAKPIIGVTVADGNALFSIGCTRKYTYATLSENVETTARF